MSQFLGDYAHEDTFDFVFTTAEPDTGAPATLSGTPAISAYVDNSTTEITAGITLTADFDSVTGLNHVRVVATTANGYAADTDVSFVITTGTVDGNSAVGYVVGRARLSRATDVLVDTEALLTGQANILSDAEAALADTEASQTTEANILADAEATLADAEASLADTNELQTDWTNGGRLDLIIDAILADTEGFSGATVANIQAGLGIHETTIATLSSQTEFTLTGGSDDDDAYNGFGCFVRDQSTSTQVCLGIVSDYVGSTRTVTLQSDPAIFTMATGDEVLLLPADADGALADILADSEAALADSEAILADTEAGSAGLDAAGVRSAIGLASANLDTQLSGILADAEGALADGEAAVLDTESLLTGQAEILADAEATLADSNELQADWTNGGRLDLILDAVLADTEAGSSGLDAAGVRAAVGLATANLDTQLGGIATDTEAAVTDAEAILLDAEATVADTGELQTDWANGGRLDLILDALLADSEASQTAETAILADAEAAIADAEAIRAKTDSLTFTQSGLADVNVQRINDAEVTGDGDGTPFDVA